LKGHTAEAGTAKFSSDGKRVVTGSEDQTARVWDSQTGREIFVTSPGTSFINDAALSPDGRYLATGGGDGLAKVWEVDTGREMISFPGDWVYFTPDSKHLIVENLGYSDTGPGTGYILDIQELMTLARSRLTRSWSPEECRQFLHTDICPGMP
jgi:WD40 repeat protein